MARQVPDNEIEPIRSAIFSGRKIEAIKRYRTATGDGLAESKAFIDALETELRRTDANQFKAGPSGKGCATTPGIILAVVVLFVLRIVV